MQLLSRSESAGLLINSRTIICLSYCYFWIRNLLIS
uniref:Uncharacterized protein n=1 Tax=Anguilla anguilla TaxID=7936 RepID=A0A0E9W0Q4_ANGAN